MKTTDCILNENMKNKISCLVRNQLFYALIVALTFFGCERIKDDAVEGTIITINGRKMEIYIIDSCEYIGYIHGSHADVLTHKGNCKFCAERK